MRKLYPNFIGGFGGLALLFVRLVIGLAFILHGWPKIQNPMGWMNAMGGSSVPALFFRRWLRWQSLVVASL
jgi:uncharacterized membrane protein YphA (DoxX/SURF4 family)